MDLFISWSGVRSKAAAKAFREWISLILQNVNPWMSDTDIKAGNRWNRELEDRLEKSNFGMVVLTPENLCAPWLLFEAGALAKTVSDSSLIPFLVGLSPTDLPPGPLTQFQAKEANRSGTLEIVKSINDAMRGEGRDHGQLIKLFNKFWPDLDAALREIPEEEGSSKTERTKDDMIEEILMVVRDLALRIEFHFPYGFIQSLLDRGPLPPLPPVPPGKRRMSSGELFLEKLLEQQSREQGMDELRQQEEGPKRPRPRPRPTHE